MASGTLGQLPVWAVDLLAAERVGHLGLLDDAGAPRVLPIVYAVCEDGVWSVIDNKRKRRQGDPARVRWLRERPQAALTVDHYEDDWRALAWVQLTGSVKVIPIREGRDALACLARRYPQYDEDPPPGPLLRLAVERALWWRALEVD